MPLLLSPRKYDVFLLFSTCSLPHFVDQEHVPRNLCFSFLSFTFVSCLIRPVACSTLAASSFALLCCLACFFPFDVPPHFFSQVMWSRPPGHCPWFHCPGGHSDLTQSDFVADHLRHASSLSHQLPFATARDSPRAFMKRYAHAQSRAVVVFQHAVCCDRGALDHVVAALSHPLRSSRKDGLLSAQDGPCKRRTPKMCFGTIAQPGATSQVSNQEPA